MGAFLVRFPKLKIHMLWYMLIFRVRFKAPAMAPSLWLLMEVFYGSLFAKLQEWHIGRMSEIVFGAVAALVIGRTGWSTRRMWSLKTIGWTRIRQLCKDRVLEKGNFDEASPFLRSIWPSNQMPSTLIPSCGSSIAQERHSAYSSPPSNSANCNVKAQDARSCLADYQEYSNAGGIACPQRHA